MSAVQQATEVNMNASCAWITAMSTSVEAVPDNPLKIEGKLFSLKKSQRQDQDILRVIEYLGWKRKPTERD